MKNSMDKDFHAVLATGHIALSFGHLTEEEKLSAKPQKGGRKEFDDVIHWNKW